MEQESRGSAPVDGDLGQRLYDVGVALGAGVLGYGSYILVTLVFQLVVLVATGDLTETEAMIISPPALALGMGAGVGFYLAVTDEGLEFLDVRRPDLRDVLYAVGGVLVLVGVAWGVEVALQYYGVEAAEHSTTETLQAADPIVATYLVVASIVFIGPGEELVFRNLVQKRLYGSFSGVGAILVASVIFAAIHVQAYGTGTVAQLLTSLFVVFVLSLLLGSIYYRTDNILVPAFVHGVYNAVVFYTTYAQQTAAL